jgi:hypothetical protein
MLEVRYIGPFVDGVDLPFGHVDQGGTVEVDRQVFDDLVSQHDWEPANAPKHTKKPAKKQPAVKAVEVVPEAPVEDAPLGENGAPA